jgi:hypothetical protein
MKNNRPATHNHKRAGSVVLLESTTVLGKVLNPSGDEFWVKLTDLTELVGGVIIDEAKPGKKQSGKERPKASANTRYRVVRAA